MANQPADNSTPDPQITRNLLQRARITAKLMGDKRVPALLKTLPVLALLYLVSPLDGEFLSLAAGPFAPLVLPLTYLDDLGVMLLALNTFIKYSPQQVVAEIQQQLSGVKPEDEWQVEEDDVPAGASAQAGNPDENPPMVEGYYSIVDDE